ncbi:hypothetical protein EON63_09165 [archaeon]|nr:MAG: hypothetical protein EON63_09165 [archaeon]
MSPDVHFALKQAHVKARSDGTGVVQFSFTLSSTVLVQIDGTRMCDEATHPSNLMIIQVQSFQSMDPIMGWSPCIWMRTIAYIFAYR